MFQQLNVLVLAGSVLTLCACGQNLAKVPSVGAPEAMPGRMEEVHAEFAKGKSLQFFRNANAARPLYLLDLGYQPGGVVYVRNVGTRTLTDIFSTCYFENPLSFRYLTKPPAELRPGEGFVLRFAVVNRNESGLAFLDFGYKEGDKVVAVAAGVRYAPTARPIDGGRPVTGRPFQRSVADE